MPFTTIERLVSVGSMETFFNAIAALPVVLALAILYAIKKQEAGAKYISVEELQALPVPRNSLFRIFQHNLVPMSDISSRGYSAALSLVQKLIGLQPTSNMVLEIWKPAFESYNLLVPNFLNMPNLVLPGHGFKDLVSLAMYVSSRANNWTYCASHCCSFSMRRGVHPCLLKYFLDAVEEEEGNDRMYGNNRMFNSRERAVIRVAHGLGSVPPSLKAQDVNTLKELMSADQVEWIVAAAAVMGLLNKFMDGLDIPLESDVYSVTMQHMDDHYLLNKTASIGLAPHRNAKRNSVPPPPVDDWTLQVATIYQGLRPGGALALDAKLLQGVPSKADDCKAYLEEMVVGANFPVLAQLQHGRLRKSLTAVLAKNFVSDGLQLRTKILAGLQYCGTLENKQLQSELQAILANVSDAKDANEELVLKAAKALSYNPSRMTASLIDEIEASSLSAENMVELVSFLASLQALHRMETYFQVASDI